MATLNMHWYGRGVEAVKDGTVDWENDTIKVALLESSYSPDQGGHTTFTDVDGHEASGDGYTAGGETLTGTVINYDASGLHVTFDADDVSWDPSSISARYAVIYEDASGRLVGYGDAGETQESVDAAFTINWNSDGIFRTTADAA